MAAGSDTISGLKDTLLLLERFVLRLSALQELVSTGSTAPPAWVMKLLEVDASCFMETLSEVRLKAPMLLTGDLSCFSSSCRSCDSFSDLLSSAGSAGSAK